MRKREDTMNERELPAEVPGRVLKSLLKKPGQTRPKSHKNRVVINEKLNEFFAADYIILIKEECCADYAEECDCCCQKPEKIRLGNCKECRADVTRNMTNTGDFTGADRGYENKGGRNGGVRGGKECEMDSSIGRDNRQGVFGCEESQEEDDEDEDDDMEEEEEEEEDDEEEEEEEEDEEEDDDSEDNDKCRRTEIANCNMPNCVTPLQKVQDRPQQQQETLSPPEGYKDVCDEDACCDDPDDHNQQRLVCGECNYYHRQRNAAAGADYSNEGKVEIREDDTNNRKEIARHGEEDAEHATNDQAQQTTPDVQQRYLVETITMTTVTERRIVREISEEEKRPSLRSDDADAINANEEGNRVKTIGDKRAGNDHEGQSAEDPKSDNDDNENGQSARISSQQQQRQKSEDSDSNHQHHHQRDGNEPPQELSLTFKLGNTTLGRNNSLKPNSAVRQLFPDPRFISPPPVPTKSAISSGSHDEATDSDSSEAQKFLITTESLRLFDAVKRSKMAGSRSDSSESETSSIKRTIERNALRRSLICKYETSTRKKNLRSKDLTLEERIRQLTCVDQDDDNTGGSSASESGAPMIATGESMDSVTTTGTTTMTTGTATSCSGVDTVDHSGEYPLRTSPSGEERPGKVDTRTCPSRIMSGTNGVQETTMTTTLLQQTSANAHHHHHHHHHHHQSTYKRITDLFAQKRINDPNLPDIGLGDKAIGAKEYSASKSTIAKMNSDARKQFLASLAPLSCVASSGVESRDDRYQLSAKQTSNPRGNESTCNRGDSIGYNSDSSYSLEDIEAALRGEERNQKNSGGPPDVTRGTPTGNGPESLDPTTDELLAFVEQDKTRNERIRRRYNETEQENACPAACRIDNHPRSESREDENNDRLNENDRGEVEDEDDELNDYGFNRRPSVRGIKPQFETSSEIVRQLRSRSLLPSGTIDKARASFHAVPPWPYYEIVGETCSEKQQITGTTFLLAAPVPPSDETEDQRNTVNPECQHRGDDDATISRINTMQKQIDDIYQTIAETASTVQVNHERASYHESTLPRAASRGANSDSCHRYSLQEQSQTLGVNGTVHYHEQHPVVGGRMLRIAGGGDGAPGTVYNTLPTKSRRPQTVAIPNYTCAVSNLQPSLHDELPPKCYRTMYLVPYNGISDPTYQNIQRILPPHSSPSYANHIERYPYPRNARAIDHATMMQQHQAGSQQPRAYYARTLPGTGVHGQPTTGLHLHLHHGQTDDFRFHQQQHATQHHQHPNQMNAYSSQTLPSYTVLAQSRPNGYPYPLHNTGNRTIATDVQTQTVSSPIAPTTSVPNCPSSVPINPCNNSVSGHLVASSSSSNSSSLSSPTKVHHHLHHHHQQQQQQRNNSSCNVAERGVPEGAASAPSHDYSQANAALHTINNSFHGHAANVPPPNTQNSVYYAMNV